MEQIAKFIQNLINRYFPHTVDGVMEDLNKSHARLEEIVRANTAVRKQNALIMERLVKDNVDRLSEELRAERAMDRILDTVVDVTP